MQAFIKLISVYKGGKQVEQAGTTILTSHLTFLVLVHCQYTLSCTSFCFVCGLFVVYSNATMKSLPKILISAFCTFAMPVLILTKEHDKFQLHHLLGYIGMLRTVAVAVWSLKCLRAHHVDLRGV